MERQVRYCTADDGVRLAFCVEGNGPTLLICPIFVESFSLERLAPEYATFIARIGAGRQTIRFDIRGTGLSQRGISEITVEKLVADLGSVLDAAGAANASLWAPTAAGPVAVTFAAKFPDRVSSLILYGSFATVHDVWPTETLNSLKSLSRSNWDLAARTFGGPTQELGKVFAESTEGEVAASLVEAALQFDTSELLASVRAPTLVIHRTDDTLVELASARDLAARIPNARLVTQPGNVHAFFVNGNSIANAVTAFLDEDPHTRASPPSGDDQTLVGAPAAAKTFAAGRYVVQRALGEGAQKIVYLVHDKALDRECALSLIKTGAFAEEELARFHREARAMAGLGAHPNIVTVFDIGEEDGRPFLICEYIAGGDLRRELHQAAGPFAVDRALAIASDLARGLGLAHERGIIHRDLKPGNVWLTERGVAKLGDFGLAAALGQTRLTMAGAMMGTAAYMSPEQALGGAVDARSDLYALGCVLYEMVAGRPPFSGDDVFGVISQHINTAPVAPSWHNPAVPPALDSLVLCLLAKSPEARPNDAVSLIGELEAIRESKQPEVAAPAPGAGGDLQGIAWGNFVGRRAELEHLRSALEMSFSGQGGLVMIAGEAGIGKSRLALEFGVYARLRGSLLLTGQCYEEISAPYGPFVEALRQYVRGADDETLRPQLGPGAPEIVTLLPELRARFPGISPALPLEGEGERMRLFESATAFVRNAAQSQPLFIVLEDLHWADKSTLLMLQYMARGIKDARVLIAATYRDVEVGDDHPLSETLAQLARNENYRRLSLAGLSEADVEELLVAIEPAEEVRAGRQALANALSQETEGNPFFMREVLSHLVEEGRLFRQEGRWTSTVTDSADLGIPRTLREVLGRRLSRLTGSCRSMLTTASGMAGRFTWEELEALSGEDEGKLLDSLDEALASQLIVEQRGERGPSYDFAHALIRQTLYEELSAPRRSLLHRRIGEALETLYAANLEPHLPDLAFHFSKGLRADNADRAVDYAARAAEVALSQTAYEEAARLYDMALNALLTKNQVDDPARCELLLAQGRALFNAGEVEGAKDSFLGVAEIARAQGYAEPLARATLGYGRRDFAALDWDPRLVELIDESLAKLGDSNPTLQVQLIARLARELSHRVEPGAQQEGHLQSRRALEQARALGDDETLFLALEAGWWTLYDTPAVNRRLELCSDMVDCARRLMDPEKLYWALDTRSCDLFQSGDFAALDRDVRAMEGIAAELRQPSLSFNLKGIYCTLAFIEGRFQDGEALLTESQRVAELIFGPAAGQYYLAMLSSCELLTDPQLLKDVESAMESLVARGGYKVALYKFRLAYFYCENDRIENARAATADVRDEDFAAWCETGFSLPISLAARVISSLGDQGRADALYAALQPYAGTHVTNGNQGYLGAADRYLGLLAATLDRWPDASRHFENALQMIARIGARPWSAITQYDYAAMLLKRGAPGDAEKAHELLDEALATAQELGMATAKKVAALKTSLD